MTRPPARRRPETALPAALVSAVLVATLGAAAPASAADPTGPELVPHGTVRVDGQDTPVLGSFRYHEFRLDSNPEIRGLVHGVRRVDGGTVLYYSVGSDDGDGKAFSGSQAFPNSSHPYKISHGTDLRLVDTTSLAAYRPLWDASTTFTSAVKDLASDAGELRVGWAVFPELPADVTSVQVLMPWGTAAGEVEVEDGALEPAVDAPAPYLGEGWPTVPQGADLAGADPAAVTFPLVRRSSDLQQRAQVAESPEAVAVTLDANVLFAKESADLSPEAQQTLTGVAQDIAERATGEVVVVGHTDSDGSDASNQTLSEQRAAAVLAVLQSAAGSGVTFRAEGRGESEPAVPNDSDANKQANRRVTVTYAVEPGTAR